MRKAGIIFFAILRIIVITLIVSVIFDFMDWNSIEVWRQKKTDYLCIYWIAEIAVATFRE